MRILTLIVSGTPSTGDTGESSDMLSPHTPGPSVLSPLHTHSYGKAKKAKKDK